MWKKLKTRMFSSSNIQVMSNAILKASKNLRRDFGELEKLQNSNSSVQNFVNNSYRNTKDLIKLELTNARPEWNLLFKKNDYEEINQKEDKLCLIKPISGISNFAKGISYFASSAIYFNNKEPEAVVIYDPIKDELFFSEKGRGAFVNNSRIRFSSTKNLSDALFVLDSKDLLLKSLNKDIFNKIESEIRIFGCSCLDLANLASGKIDCYVCEHELEKFLEPGILLIKEAGGIVYNYEYKKNLTFYSNSYISDFLKDLL